MFEFGNPDGECCICHKPGVVNISGINLCLTHASEETSMTKREMRDFLNELQVNGEATEDQPMKTTPEEDQSNPRLFWDL